MAHQAGSKVGSGSRISAMLLEKGQGAGPLQKPTAPNEKTAPLTRKIYLYLPSVFCSGENIP